jgi:hypothetical protein
MRLLGLILLVGGVLAAIYGGFTYTKDSSELDLGVAEIEIKDRERVNIPLWVGIGAAAVGAVLVVVDRRKLTS